MDENKIAGFFEPSSVKTKLFSVTLKGGGKNSRLIMNALPEEEVRDLCLKKKAKDDDQKELTPQQIAEKSIYRDNKGRIGLPGMNIFSCLRQAGQYISWGAPSDKKMITRRTDGSTLLPSFLQIVEDFILFETDDSGVTNEGWEIDIRNTKKRRGKPKKSIIRPIFTYWKATFTIKVTYIGPEVTDEMVEELFKVGGREIGLCAFRRELTPKNASYKYPFGRFYVEEIKMIKEAKVA